VRLRPAVVALAGGLALTVGAPAVWTATRPATAAGPPLAAVVAPAVPEPAVPEPAVPEPGAGALPQPAAHPAAPVPLAAVPVPVRLVVPGAGVDAPVDPVGVTGDGLLQLPDDVHRVGWYRFGPAPGEPDGTAVLAGHVDAWDQGLGALGRLRGVDPGQVVEVADSAGGVTRWQVVTRRLVGKQDVPLAQLFARTGPPRLVLLTCGGPFDERLRSYRDNLVVVAEPVR
jgi:Sortase domain